MAQINILERATEAIIQLNGNKRSVIEIWLNGIKVWPIHTSEQELRVDRTLVVLSQQNNFRDVINVLANDSTSWEFGN